MMILGGFGNPPYFAIIVGRDSIPQFSVDWETHPNSIYVYQMQMQFNSYY